MASNTDLEDARGNEEMPQTLLLSGKGAHRTSRYGRSITASMISLLAGLCRVKRSPHPYFLSCCSAFHVCIATICRSFNRQCAVSHIFFYDAKL